MFMLATVSHKQEVDPVVVNTATDLLASSVLGTCKASLATPARPVVFGVFSVSTIVLISTQSTTRKVLCTGAGSGSGECDAPVDRPMEPSALHCRRYLLTCRLARMPP